MLSFKRNGAPFLRNGCADFAEYAQYFLQLAQLYFIYDELHLSRHSSIALTLISERPFPTAQSAPLISEFFLPQRQLVLPQLPLASAVPLS